jgi:hypothetical protein
VIICQFLHLLVIVQNKLDLSFQRNQHNSQVRDSIVPVMTRLQAERWRYHGLITSRGEIFSPEHPDCFFFGSPNLSVGTRDSVAGRKAARM